MKILIIEDEKDIIERLTKKLKEVSDFVTAVDNYKDAEELLSSDSFDCILCDHHLSNNPDEKQGIDLIRDLRSRKIQTPVLLITGRSFKEITPWEALDIGVDDFLPKPFRIEELIARVKAIYRRSFQTEGSSTNVITCGDVKLNLDQNRVFVKDKEVSLSRTQFLLLSYFLKNPDRVVTHEEFINYVWGGISSFSSYNINALRVHMHELKKQLKKHNIDVIKNIRSLGYIMDFKGAHEEA